MLLKQLLYKLKHLSVLPAIGLIRGYQILISPFLGKRCRFYPSCSHYGLEALKVHGLIKGGWLLTKRLLRCHPFSEGGIDAVPRRIKK